jgi:hypothetical protein
MMLGRSRSHLPPCPRSEHAAGPVDKGVRGQPSAVACGQRSLAFNGSIKGPGRPGEAVCVGARARRACPKAQPPRPPQVRTYHLCDDELRFKLAAAGRTCGPARPRPEYGSRIPRPRPPPHAATLPPHAGRAPCGSGHASAGGSGSIWIRRAATSAAATESPTAAAVAAPSSSLLAGRSGWSSAVTVENASVARLRLLGSLEVR